MSNDLIQPNLICILVEFHKEIESPFDVAIQTFQRMHPFARIQFKSHVSLFTQGVTVIPPRMSMMPFLCAMTVRPLPALDLRSSSWYNFARHPLFERKLLPIIFAFAASPHIVDIYQFELHSLGVWPSLRQLQRTTKTFNPYTKQEISLSVTNRKVFF